MWQPFDDGRTIGMPGSKSGTVLRMTNTSTRAHHARARRGDAVRDHLRNLGLDDAHAILRQLLGAD
jgi:hypothetical protein